MKYKEYFKKGSMIPWRLGIFRTTLRKAQHGLLFGTDVVWDGQTLRPTRPMVGNESLVLVPTPTGEPRKNGTFRKCGFGMMSKYYISTTSERDGNRTAILEAKDGIGMTYQSGKRHD